MYYYIINPSSGRGAINGIYERLQADLQKLRIAGEFVKTSGPGDATLLASKAVRAGYNTIVAVGGDETVNEVMNGIHDPAVALGIIPIGRTNRIATQLGIPHWQAAGPVLAGRRLVSYQLIGAGQHVFLSDLRLGFETDIEKKLDPKTDKLASRLGHFTKSWGQARQFSTLSASIRVDDTYDLDCQTFSLTVSNQKFHDPLADNRLVVTIASRPNRRQLTSYLWNQTRRGGPVHDDHIDTRFYAKKIIVDTDPSTGIMIDGKVTGRTPIAIRLTSRSVRFICGKPVSAFKPAA